MNRVLCFFFKQKTSYEVRISDWRADVCSSDLKPGVALCAAGSERLREPRQRTRVMIIGYGTINDRPHFSGGTGFIRLWGAVPRTWEIGRASCRARVCQYV